MATTPIKLKRSNTISVIPDTSDLIEGEVALNTVDKKFYVRDGSSQVITLINHYATDFDVNVVTFKVTVATSASAHPYHGVGSSNKYKINGVFSPYLKLIPKVTYRFDQSDSSNSGHPLLFYYDAGKASAFTTGVTVVNGSSGPGSSGAYTQIVVSDSTPQVLHYQCSSHANMGWALTTSTRNLTGFDTDDLSEGSSNLYFTNARADARITNALKDEDNMASNSATHVPSQQSVKAYIDSSISGISTTSLNTGAITYDDNEILGTRSNENILITPAGTGAVVISKLETGSISAPSTLSGTYTISSPTTITLSPTSEIINTAPMKLLGKTIAQLRAGFTASNGSMVAVSDDGHKPAYYDGSNWKYVATNGNV